jgi:sensor histidine kinase YesM
LISIFVGPYHRLAGCRFGKRPLERIQTSRRAWTLGEGTSWCAWLKIGDANSKEMVVVVVLVVLVVLVVVVLLLLNYYYYY